MTFRHLTWFATFLLAASVLGASPSVAADDVEAAPSRPNLVLIVIDTLRGDFVASPENAGSSGLVRTTAALGDHVFFTNCQSQSSWTRPSMCTLFTGLYPTSHGVLRGYGADDRGGDSDGENHQLRETVVTLAEVLSAAGYRTLTIQTNPHLGLSVGMGQGFDHFLYKTDGPGSWVTDRALQWIGQTARPRARVSAPPLFLYLHYLDPHMPYRWHEDVAYPEGTERRGITMERMMQGGLAPEEIEQQRRLYRGEVEAVDREVARFLTQLSGDPHWANTLVVITSDHGEEFWEHGGFEHGHSLHRELLQVPLLIGGPALAVPARVVNEQVRLLDLMPTVLDLCGLPAPPMQGTSFAPSLRTGAAVDSRTSFAEGILYGEPRWSYRDARSTQIVRLTSGSWELFDPASDPWERTNLLPEIGSTNGGPSAARAAVAPAAVPPAAVVPAAVARAAEIEALLRSWHRENRAISESFGPMQPPLHDPEQRERLRSLGYIR